MVKMILGIVALGVLSFLISVLCIPTVRKVAISLNLVDKPNFRKVHQNPVPLVGGISIALVFALCSFVFIGERKIFEYLLILMLGYLLLIIGVIDDKNDLSAKLKLIVQLLLAFFIAFSGTRITSFYGIFGISQIHVYLQYILTIVVITGVVNAFNLMDGVDGLVGGLSIFGFTLLLLAGIVFNDIVIVKMAIIFIGAIIGFLKFNFSKKKIFMGDGGSLFLGFLLVTLGIHVMEKQATNKEHNYFYMILILIAFFIIPVLDSIRVYLTRIKNGNSPFRADKTHLHHILLRLGYTHKNVAIWVLNFAIFLFVIALTLVNLTSITLSVVMLMAIFYIVMKLLVYIISLYKWQSKIKEMENT